MIKAKVYDKPKAMEKRCDLELKGTKLDIMAEFVCLTKTFIDNHLDPGERFAFLMTLIQRT